MHTQKPMTSMNRIKINPKIILTITIYYSDIKKINRPSYQSLPGTTGYNYSNTSMSSGRPEAELDYIAQIQNYF